MPGHEIIGEEEKNEVISVFDNGSVLFRHGFDKRRNGSYKVSQFENEFAIYHKSAAALAVTSGTAALRVGLAALNIGCGDEVITSAFTFVATVEAIVESGATPICVDVDESLTIDYSKVEESITHSTKAIIVVHMLGVPCNMDEILKICKKHGLYLIEDTAWGCGGKFKSKHLGTLGDLGAYSFDFAKTITTGEGGMIIASNIEHLDRARAWHDHGHENNPKLPRWEDSRSSSGFNFRMSELQAAVGIAQLRKLDKLLDKQRSNKSRLSTALKSYSSLRERTQFEGSEETADAFVFFAQDSQMALDIRKSLCTQGISTKILPEAISWHFAGMWSHIPELVAGWQRRKNEEKPYQVTLDLLSKSVSMPVNYYMDLDTEQKLHNAIQQVI